MEPGKTCTEGMVAMGHSVMGERATRVVSAPRIEGVVGEMRRVSLCVDMVVVGELYEKTGSPSEVEGHKPTKGRGKTKKEKKECGAGAGRQRRSTHFDVTC